MKTHIVTSSGFGTDLDADEIRDDWELLEDVIALDRGDQTKIISIGDRILGEQKKDLIEHCRGKNGRVRFTAMSAEVIEILNALKQGKNS